jgi:hypothetical protein
MMRAGRDYVGGGHPIYDVNSDTYEFFGIRYHSDLFRTLGLGAIGTVLRIIKREDGVVTLETVESPPLIVRK